MRFARLWVRLPLALFLWAWPAAAEEDAHGFDHRAHEAELVGREKLACTKCHVPAGPKGKLAQPGQQHRPCNEAGCHPRAWEPPIQERVFEKLCLSCHRVAGKGSRARLEVAYPPFAIGPEHVTRFSHRTHADLPACVSCHASPGAGAQANLGRGHALCAGCHDERTKPVMTDCAACHKDAQAADAEGARRVQRLADPFRVQAGFSHALHERKVPEGKDCRLCHENLARAVDGQVLPFPSMRQCADICHDGKKAFDALGTTCARCHQASGGAQAPEALPLRYSHAAHAPRLAREIDCAACHPIDAQARVMPVLVGKNHQPCSLSGCHREDFFAREPKICAGCHADARPWIKAQMPLLSGSTASEFSVEMFHQDHVDSTVSSPPNAVCAPCHADPDLEGGLALPGHEYCARCHGGTTRPHLNECSECHRLAPPRVAPEPFFAWSVASTFSHAQHRADPRAPAAETACTHCHATLARTRQASEIRPPIMASCDACHDGKRAFKTTGFDCFRCHAGKAKTLK